MAAEKFQTWAVVELMGHQRIAGYVSEVEIAGHGMIRVDVPDTGERPRYSKVYGPSAIYAITPCEEELAKRVAHELEQWSDPIPVRLPAPELVLASGDEDDELPY